MHGEGDRDAVGIAIAAAFAATAQEQTEDREEEQVVDVHAGREAPGVPITAGCTICALHALRLLRAGARLLLPALVTAFAFGFFPAAGLCPEPLSFPP